jgi:Na+-driven multidrug efflux pump
MITALLCLKRLQSRKTPIYWKTFDFHMDKGIVREIMRVGLSCYVRNMLPALSSAIYNKQVFVYSTDFVAGCSIGRNASYFMNFFIQGAANGYMPFASYNYGAGNYKRLYKSIVWSLAVLTGYSLITDAVIWKFAYEYIGLFAANEASIEYGVRYILAYTLSLPIYAAYYILTISLQAAGKGKESMILSVSRQGLIYIPLVMILPIFFRENGIYYTQPLSAWITVILAVILSWHLLKEIYHGSKAAGQLE